MSIDFSSDPYQDIRPYYDHEVRLVLDRLLNNPEFFQAMGRFRFPWLNDKMPGVLHGLLRWFLGRQVAKVETVDDLQDVIEKYMSFMIHHTTSGVTQTGAELLPKDQAFLFISNHRDIAMDPGFINFTLYHAEMSTVRIAIGDNLLTNPFVTDLMKLNKCFIVNRSASGREAFKALKHLSSYIHHSLCVENSPIWIAQREGRAKDGCDSTEPAIIKMFAMSKAKKQDFGEFIAELNVVPVAISYEWDPLDVAKSKELVALEETGHYEKGAQEDVESIGAGIIGKKGRVHVSYGTPLTATEASAPDAVAAAIDVQVIGNYYLHPSNVAAYEMLTGQTLTLAFHDCLTESIGKAKQTLQERMAGLPERQQQVMLAGYANPVLAKLRLRGQDAPLSVYKPSMNTELIKRGR